MPLPERMKPTKVSSKTIQDPDMLHIGLSPEEIAGYLMARSGRLLADAPELELKYPTPDTDDDK